MTMFQMAEHDGSSHTATVSQQSLGRKSLRNFGSSKFSLRNNSLSGAKRKRPISLRASNSELNDGRRSNKRNSNNPATSSHVIDSGQLFFFFCHFHFRLIYDYHFSDSDLELLSSLPNYLSVGDSTLAAFEQIELDESEAFARQLQSDEALARQLQEKYDAELARTYNSFAHRRRYFGGRSRPTPTAIERREASLTPPPAIYPSSRSPSLSVGPGSCPQRNLIEQI